MKMIKALIPVAAAFTLGFGVSACDDGYGENAGEEIDEAIDDTGDAMDDAADDVDDAIDDVND